MMMKAANMNMYGFLHISDLDITLAVDCLRLTSVNSVILAELLG